MKTLFSRFRALTGTLLLLLFLCSGAVFASCSNEATGDITNPNKKWLFLDKNVATMMTGDDLTINLTFSDSDAEELEYVWTSSDESIATVSYDAFQGVATVTGHKPGKAIIKVECPGESRRLASSCSVTISQSPTRILAIGNSFSQDAVEQYLYELIATTGTKVIIGNAYIGGCSLATHVENANENKSAYFYRKIVSGTKTEQQNKTLAEILLDEKWDYICLQQVSGQSGLPETWAASLPELVDWVRNRATNKHMQLMLHQTWAYAANSTHEDFPKYDKNQMKMYEAIVSAVNGAAQLEGVGIDIIIPSGTAIQNARTSFMGDTFNRDGYHLEVTYGRYTAACVWFERLFGVSVVGNSYAPATINADQKKIAQAAAHAAVLEPNAVTDLVDFKRPSVTVGDTPVYIDFGPTVSAAGEAAWNDFNSIKVTAPTLLKDINGAWAAAMISVEKPFTAFNNGVGTETATEVNGVPISRKIMADGFYAKEADPSTLLLENLDPAYTYNLTICGLRFNSGVARGADYTVRGATTEVKNLVCGTKVAGLFPNVAVVMRPDADGKIRISVAPDAANTYEGGCINALMLVRGALAE